MKFPCLPVSTFPMIFFQDVSKHFGERAVINGLNLQVQPQEMVALIGQSGAGKSTLFNLLLGMFPPTAGTIQVDHFRVHELDPDTLQQYRRNIGVIFQDYKLLPYKTVAENISFALEVCDLEDEEVKERVDLLLNKLRLEHRRDAFPHELSGGEQQRTAIARALIHDPKIILADEPTGDLDPEQSEDIINVIKGIHQSGVTVIIASHDRDLVKNLNCRVVKMQDGKIVAEEYGKYI